MTISNRSAESERDVAYLLHPITNYRIHEEIGPFTLERGEGIRVFDTDGKSYIDGMAGLWCASLGFSEPRLAAAAQRQMEVLPYESIFAHRSNLPCIDLAEALINRAPVPMSKVMFQTSGSEAIDTAIKLVWYYQDACGKPNKRKMISRTRSYHGTTIASASLTGQAPMHNGFGLPIADFIQTGSPHYYRDAREDETEEQFASRLAQELEEQIVREGPDLVGAFFAEPVIGAGGVILPPSTYFEKIQAVLNKYDILLVADEVICGFCRTGNYWGSQTYGMKPDILVCAKALSAAYFPISAVMINDSIYQAIADQSQKLGAFAHGYTYGGHPVGAAIALETLRIYDNDDILGHVRTVSPTLQQGYQGLADHPMIGNVRGVGLLAAVEFMADKERKIPFDPSLKVPVKVMDAARERGILLRALGDSLVCSPPLIITPSEIEEIVAGLTAAVDQVHDWARTQQDTVPA